MCFEKRKNNKPIDNKEKKDLSDIYYCTTCKKEFVCVYDHIYSLEHINNSSLNIFDESTKNLLESKENKK